MRHRIGSGTIVTVPIGTQQREQGLLRAMNLPHSGHFNGLSLPTLARRPYPVGVAAHVALVQIPAIGVVGVRLGVARLRRSPDVVIDRSYALKV